MKWSHFEWNESIWDTVHLCSVIGRKEGVEHAKELALLHISDVADSDSIIQTGRIWNPQGVAIMKTRELIPISVVVGHDGERKKLGVRCSAVQKAYDGFARWHRLQFSASYWFIDNLITKDVQR